MSIGPRPPWLRYVLVFRPPFNPDLKRSIFSFRRFVGEPLIVAGSVMRLSVSCQMLYLQISRGNTSLQQTPYVPDGKAGLPECSL